MPGLQLKHGRYNLRIKVAEREGAKATKEVSSAEWKPGGWATVNQDGCKRAVLVEGRVRARPRGTSDSTAAQDNKARQDTWYVYANLPQQS